jgi:CBS domain containing-hemolysin-like protein
LGLGWLGEPFLAQMIEPFFALAGITSPVLIETVAFALAFATITILHIVLGELAPKSIAIRKAVPTTLWISRPLSLFYFIFQPAIWLLNGMANWLLKRIFHIDPVAESELAHSEEELRLILDESARADRISTVSQEIVANAFEIRRRVVREVMTPRKDMLAQLEEPEPSLLAIKRELVAVPEMMPLEKLLTRFRDRQAHLAVVVDEFGGNVGIVTLQNVIAEVIGRLPDEFGLNRREFQRLSEDEFLVDGGLGLYELYYLAGLEWKDEDVTTVAGYVVHRLGYLPAIGEQLRLDDYIVTVEQTDGRRVQQLRFRRATTAPNAAKDSGAARKP